MRRLLHLQMIWRRLSDRYLVIPFCFEGVADEMFESHASFVRMFANLNFLGMLCNKYLQRNKEGLDFTVHNVNLTGVYDVKNLKLKIRPEVEKKKYNSPWNIATDFNVDMTFHPEEIAQMIGDYENDAHPWYGRGATSSRLTSRKTKRIRNPNG